MPIYSDDPKEEARMLEIRDHPNNRLTLIGRSRSVMGRAQERMSDTELLWIQEDLRSGHIALLQPAEYWAVIKSLSDELDRARRGIKWMSKQPK